MTVLYVNTMYLDQVHTKSPLPLLPETAWQVPSFISSCSSLFSLSNSLDLISAAHWNIGCLGLGQLCSCSEFVSVAVMPCLEDIVLQPCSPSPISFILSVPSSVTSLSPGGVDTDVSCRSEHSAASYYQHCDHLWVSSLMVAILKKLLWPGLRIILIYR